MAATTQFATVAGGHDFRRSRAARLRHRFSHKFKYQPESTGLAGCVGCGRCADCLGGRANLCAERQIISMPPRQGAFAEYVALPERNLVEVPEGMSPTVAALAEPVATGLHAVFLAHRHAHRPLSEGRALVMGGA